MLVSRKAFVSYSRADSQFVLRLCQDLRSAGASIWLDRLDISAGEEWDREIERGLAECGRLLVVLSPDSVSSQNVLDEVGFALAKKKTVIPIIVRDCEVPYRLSRLQYIDFRKDYSNALQELSTALREDKDTRAEPAAVSIEHKSERRPNRRFLLAGVAALVIALLGWAAWDNRTVSVQPATTVTAPAADSPPPQEAAETKTSPAQTVANQTPPASPNPPFRQSFRDALLRYIAAAPAGFQAVGAQEFVDWTPSVILPSAESCRGSGYPREPVIECVLYRTNSELEATNKFEDLIELTQAALPTWEGHRLNFFRAFFSSKNETPTIGLGVNKSNGTFEVELAVRPRSEK